MDTLGLLPTKLQPGNLAIRNYENMLFYGGDSVFSNFYQCSFELDGQVYNSVEQYFQNHLAERCGDETTKELIMKTTNSIDQHLLGKKIRVDPTYWNHDTAKQVMKTGSKAKFQQDEVLKKQLLSTGSKMLVECNKYDRFWGVGLSLNDDSALNKTQWKGENQLGNILIKVRENLK